MSATPSDGQVFDLLGTAASTRLRAAAGRDGEEFDLSGVASGRTRPLAVRDGFVFSYLGDRSDRVRNVVHRGGALFDLLGPWRSTRAFGAKRDGVLFDLLGPWRSTRTRVTNRREATTFFIGGGGPAPVPTNYLLAAVDTGVGRRYWSSLTLDFASAPAPVGAWVTSSLTILGEWT